MRHFITIFLSALFFLTGCSPEKDMLQPGVSLHLARERKENITGVHYYLFFHLPEKRQDPVHAVQSVTFNLEKKCRVVLDFKAPKSALYHVAVNGHTLRNNGRSTLKNEHLVLPEKYMEQGENTIEIVFRAGDLSLNRNEDFLYTLLVPDRARTLFPCFDQPNLKAVYTLTLEVPAHWQAVSNTPVAKETEIQSAPRKRITFHPTEPLSTYLFSFVAGEFQKETACHNGRSITMYHRETDPDKIAQVPVIFEQVFASLEWMEAYTGIPYPFAKYDFIVLPGFQYGGMEHTGATLYNDKRLFLGTQPTTAEQLGRMSLIAHETAHMWFGDYVTMEWFDEVWLKEVFANYFAAQMTQPQFPQVNHRLNKLHSFYTSAYSIDRTRGTHPIVQPLDNLDKAGLIYGNIIYNKAPIVMDMLAEQMGAEAFREGLRRYLRTYAYGNATWGQLIALLDELTSNNLAAWSRVWVHEAGMPHVYATAKDGILTVTQTDPLGRGLLWPQPATFTLVGKAERGRSTKRKRIQIDLTGEKQEIAFEQNALAQEVYVLPNSDGKAYGVFLPDSLSLEYILNHLTDIQDEVERMSLLMILYENLYIGRLAPERFKTMLLNFLPQETNALIQNRALSYLGQIFVLYGDSTDGQIERYLYRAATDPQQDNEYRLLAFRTLLRVFTEESITSALYDVWDAHPTTFAYLPLDEAEYTRLAYELMVRLPDEAPGIRERQRARITNPDRRKAFEFIARGCNPDPNVRNAFFQSLLLPHNRHTEPWVVTAMEYLNHFLYREHALRYIRPVLEHLEEVRQTGDIFFPTQWLNACLGNHNSPQAAAAVQAFLKEHPQYDPLLRNKILQAADHLLQQP